MNGRRQKMLEELEAQLAEDSARCARQREQERPRPVMKTITRRFPGDKYRTAKHAMGSNGAQSAWWDLASDEWVVKIRVLDRANPLVEGP